MGKIKPLVEEIEAILSSLSNRDFILFDEKYIKLLFISYFGDGVDEADMVYNFTLPPLVLYSFLKADASKLTEWADSLERLEAGNYYFNFLASHDGVGLRPVEGILAENQFEKVVEKVKSKGGLVSYKTNSDGSKSPYELNFSYVDVIRDRNQKLITQVKQFMASQSIIGAFIFDNTNIGGQIMKIVVLDGYTLNSGDLSWEGLKKLGEVEIYDRTPENKILERAEGAEVLLTNKTPLSRETIRALPELEYIGVLATGYNIVAVEAAADKEIVVTNVPSYGSNSVAQFTMALLLEACHQVGEHSRAVKSGAWSEADDFCFWDYPLIELQNKTLGIIGFGSIGQRTAELANVFGMELIVYDRSPEKKINDSEIETERIDFVDLFDLYRRSDVISLHCPLTAETEGMINQASLAQMREGVIIINTARGGLIVESELAAALETGKVKTAALDVLSTEPPAASNPLLNSDKTIVTPHIAWASRAARERLLETVVANLKSFLANNVENQVN